MIGAERRLDERCTVPAMHGYAAYEPVVSQIRPANIAVDAEPFERARGCDEVAVVIDATGAPRQPLDDWLRDAWADLREAWAQTTFFVLDSNSWG